MTSTSRVHPPGGGDDELPRRAPYRLRTARLQLRPYAPADAPALLATLTESREHLLPWLPWAADEPTSLARKIDLVLRFRAAFDRAEDFSYGLFDPADGRLVGGAGLHPRAAPGVAMIGYWLAARARGRGLVTEAATALVQVAFEELALARVEIRCDPGNEPSARVALRLGFLDEGVLRAHFQAPDGTRRDTRMLSLLRAEYEHGPLRHVHVERYDALERRLRRPPDPSSPSPTA